MMRTHAIRMNAEEQPQSCMAKKRPGGMTLVEFSIVLVIVTAFALFLLNRLQRYQYMAEKVAVEQTVDQLRWGLRLVLAQEAVTGHAGDLAQIADQNPMLWLVYRPVNYLGDISASTQRNSLKKEAWYYDHEQHQLIYVSAEPSLNLAYACELIVDPASRQAVAVHLKQIPEYQVSG